MDISREKLNVERLIDEFPRSLRKPSTGTLKILSEDPTSEGFWRECMGDRTPFACFDCLSQCVTHADAEPLDWFTCMGNAFFCYFGGYSNIGAE